MRLHVVSLLQPLVQDGTLKGSWRPKYISFVHLMDILNKVRQALSLRMALPNRKVFFVPFKTIFEKQILAKAESNCAFFRDN